HNRNPPYMFLLLVFRRCYFCSAFMLPLLLSCTSTGSTDSEDDLGTGGDLATGGHLATGGESSETGGNPGTGGDAGTGGDSATGGYVATVGNSGTGGDATVDPDLETLLLEGVGDIEKPPPYAYGPYSQGRDDVPHGTVEQFTFEEDEFYPDHPPRGIKVFEPAQYEEGEEVFLAVFFDGTANWAYLNNDSHGGAYRTLNVLDNLMAEGLIPPFIGVFIGNDGDGGNRQAELAPVNDTQARFILEAVLPAVSERYGYNFSSDPKKRAIIGESSG